MSVFGDPDVVPLWFGEGDLVTPDFVRDAAAKGLQAGETFYTWQRGIPELRAALSAYTERLYGIKCPVDRLTVTTGGMQAILLSLPASARSRRQYRDRLADLAEHHLGDPAGARRAQIRGARPQAGRRLDARPAEGVRRGRRSHARDLRQLAGQSHGLDDDVPTSSARCSTSPGSAASGSWPTRSMPA